MGGRLHALIAGLGAALLPVEGAHAVDWAAVPARDVVVFHTGQASWEWLLVPSDHSGGEKMREGKACQDCHADEERKIGELVASGEKLEPDTARVTSPWRVVKAQFAHDGEQLHARFTWPATGPSATKSDVAWLFDDGTVKEAKLGGCFATCHADLPGMPHELADADLTKYLVQSRTRVTRTGGGTNLKPPDALEQLRTDGVFLEFWRALLESDGPAVEDGIVLARRQEMEPALARVTGERQGDEWVAVLSRALQPSQPGRKALVPGKSYVFGIAVHEGDAEDRFHLVSLEYTLALDAGDADFVARKQ